MEKNAIPLFDLTTFWIHFWYITEHYYSSVLQKIISKNQWKCKNNSTFQINKLDMELQTNCYIVSLWSLVVLVVLGSTYCSRGGGLSIMCCWHESLLVLQFQRICGFLFQVLTCPNETTKVFNQVSASSNLDFIVAVADTNVVCIWKRLKLEDGSSPTWQCHQVLSGNLCTSPLQLGQFSLFKRHENIVIIVHRKHMFNIWNSLLICCCLVLGMWEILYSNVLSLQFYCYTSRPSLLFTVHKWILWGSGDKNQKLLWRAILKLRFLRVFKCFATVISFTYY